MLPPSVFKAIERIRKLDLKQRELQQMAKAMKITDEKAKIWNTIRSFGIPGTGKTLWQAALAAGLPVLNSGREIHLDFFAEDIDKLLKAEKEEFPSKTLRLQPHSSQARMFDIQKIADLMSKGIDNLIV